jgi:hypothetical protein
VTLGAWIRAGIIPGTGNPVQFLAAASTTHAVCQINYVASGAATLVLKPTTQATSACTLEAFAYGGAITLQLAAGTDRINGGTAGASLVVPQGYTADIWNDGAGNYYVILMLGTAATNVVTSWNGRNGVVTMTAADITGAGGALAANSVSSFNTRTGAVTLTTADVTGAGGAPLASPGLTGTPTAPTAAPGTNTTQLATTGFVATSFAPLTSPTFTGTPAAPTPAVNDNTTKVATTAYVQGQGSNAVPLMDGTAAAGTALTWTRGDHVHPIDTSRAPVTSPTFTGVPAAPTAAPGDNTTALATTAFVTAAVAAATTGVSSWNGRTGAVTLTQADVAAVGVSSFNGRVGAVGLTTADVTAVGGAPIVNPTFTTGITTPLAVIDGPAGTVRNLLFDTGGSRRWQIDTDSTPEAGANAGSNLIINAYNDAGALLATAMSANRASGAVSFPNTATIKGVTDGSNAAAGLIGEFASTSNIGATPSSANVVSLVQLTLSAGDWDVWGNAGMTNSVLLSYFAIGLSAGTLALAFPTMVAQSATSAIFTTNTSLTAPMVRISITAPTTVYLAGQLNFPSGVPTVNAYISARRVR